MHLLCSRRSREDAVGSVTLRSGRADRGRAAGGRVDRVASDLPDVDEARAADAADVAGAVQPGELDGRDRRSRVVLVVGRRGDDEVEVPLVGGGHPFGALVDLVEGAAVAALAD